MPRVPGARTTSGVTSGAGSLSGCTARGQLPAAEAARWRQSQPNDGRGNGDCEAAWRRGAAAAGVPGAGGVASGGALAQRGDGDDE